MNDHEELRRDPLLAVLAGRRDPTGADRADARDRGAPLAGKSTLNRLELTPARASAKSRYKKIAARHGKIDEFFVETFLELTGAAPAEVVLDLDATDDPLHGHQLGRFFHGYYDGYCYLPLYIFCGEHLLCAKLRPADIDGSAGALKQVARITEQLRRRWPLVKIILRADSGFCREPLMAWCEEHGVDYVFGLAKARCDTLRLKLLKIGAQVRVTVRRVWFSLAESYPYQALFAQVFDNLIRWRPLPPTAAPA